MEPLFLSKPMFDKVADVKLSKNTDNWMQDVVQYLHQAHPWMKDTNIRVLFNRTDPEEGAGVGQVQLDDKVSIPIVIDQFRMQPLDIFWHSNKLYPLTKSSLQEVLSTQTLGSSVEPGEGSMSDISLFSRTQAPYDGRYVYADLLGVDRDDIYEAAKRAFKFDELDFVMKTNPVFKEVLSDWMKVAWMKDNQPPLTKEKTIDKERKGGKAEDIHKQRPQPITKEDEDKVPPTKQVKKAGVYDVPLGMGTARCVVADHVIGMDGLIRPDIMAAFEIDGNRYTYDEEIYGTPVKTASASRSQRPSGWGAFVFHKMGRIIATEPFKVEATYKNSEGLDRVIASSIDGPKAINMSKDIEKWAMFNGELYINDKWVFVPCGKPEKAARPMIHDGWEALDKIAEAFMPKTDPKVIHVNRPGNLFKEASEIVPVSRDRAPWWPLFNIRGDSFQKVALDVTPDQAKKTVDAVLGLNFITDENSYKFSEQLNKVAEAKEVCAKLLLASRLGLPLSQAPLRTAMYALDSVERDLKQFSQTVDVRED